MCNIILHNNHRVRTISKGMSLYNTSQHASSGRLCVRTLNTYCALFKGVSDLKNICSLTHCLSLSSSASSSSSSPLFVSLPTEHRCSHSP